MRASRRWTLFCTAGLANRIRVLVSGQVLAEAAGAELEFLWPLTDECGCPYERLFVPDPRVRTVPASAVQGKRMLLSSVPDLLAEEGEVVLGHFGWLVKPGLYPAHAALEPRLAERFAALTPHPALLARAQAFVDASFRPRMIGVHLRRGDFIGARPNASGNTAPAVARLAELLAADSEAGVFLATDDGASVGLRGEVTEGVRAVMRRRFGERVVFTIPRTLDRGAPEAIEDALVDLLLLRRTDAIIGTQHSSFSAMGAFGREVPYYPTAGVHEHMNTLERFAIRIGARPLVIALGRRALEREPTSFLEAWQALRNTRVGTLTRRVARRLRRALDRSLP